MRTTRDSPSPHPTPRHSTLLHFLWARHPDSNRVAFPPSPDTELFLPATSLHATTCPITWSPVQESNREAQRSIARFANQSGDFPSLHHTPPHSTPLHSTTRHLTSLHGHRAKSRTRHEGHPSRCFSFTSHHTTSQHSTAPHHMPLHFVGHFSGVEPEPRISGTLQAAFPSLHFTSLHITPRHPTTPHRTPHRGPLSWNRTRPRR